jgi:hypothetical protein
MTANRVSDTGAKGLSYCCSIELPERVAGLDERSPWVCCMSSSSISLRYGHVSAAAGLLIVASLLSGCRACQGEPPPELPQRPQEASAAAENGGDAGTTAQEEQDAGSSRPQRPTTVHSALPGVEDFAVSPVEGNWAMFRGNNDRSGLRNAAPITQPSVIWSQEIGIQGYANTTIVNLQLHPHSTFYHISPPSINRTPPSNSTAIARSPVYACNIATSKEEF